MCGLNKGTWIGCLGKDPEGQILKGGIAVIKFSLATTESYTNDSGQILIQTQWHSVVVWRLLAESMIYLEGKLKTRTYEDKMGIKRYVTEIIADSFIMLDKPIKVTDISKINAGNICINAKVAFIQMLPASQPSDSIKLKQQNYQSYLTPFPNV